VSIMTTVKSAAKIALMGSFVVLAGCSSREGKSGESGNVDSTFQKDRSDIQATLLETAERWRYGDKAVLYDQEFEYAQVQFNYDQYLEIPKIKRIESDTVRAFNVKDVKFFDRDSAHVAVDVVFVGPTADTTHMPQEWTMFYHRGRWIRPTMSTPEGQREFEERRRVADSAAAAEENEKW